MTLTDAFADAAMESDSTDAQGILNSLSEGQCEVLDCLLGGYETNKEVALKLNISPSTVAQRIGLAAIKLRTRGRSATKREYERLRRVCAFSVYSSQHIPISAGQPQQPPRAWSEPSPLTLHDAVRFERHAPWADRVENPTILEAFVEKLNATSASTIIVGQAVLISILAVVMLAILGMFYEFDFLRFVT